LKFNFQKKYFNNNANSTKPVVAGGYFFVVINENVCGEYVPQKKERDWFSITNIK